MDHALYRLFHPESVAVIGASEIPGKAAERRTRSLIEGGFQGEILLINPKRDTIFGRKAYPSIRDVGRRVDLVMVVVPPKLIPQAVTDSVAMGAKGIVIITAGLGESGAAGKKIEQDILETAAAGGAKIIGPNCSGIFSAPADMNLLGLPAIRKGPLAVIAQSGNIIDSLTHYAALRGIGLSAIISAGNAIGTSFHEFIEYLDRDADTRVIMMYLEGIRDGEALVRAARATTPQKPIIVLKAGRSRAGMRAAASHTGSLASDDGIVDAAFRQAGIVRVSNVDEMFDIAECFARLPLPAGRRVAIVSEGGGDNSVAADNAELKGLEVPILPESTQEKIRPFLLQGMPAGNPIDYGGTAEENPDMINKTVEVLMQETQVNAVYVTGFFGGFKEIIAPHVGELEEKTSRELGRLMQAYRKPVVVHTSFANEPFPAIRILRENGIFVTTSSERAARCLSAMADFSRERDEIIASAPVRRPPASGDRAAAILLRVKGEKRANLTEPEARALLGGYGIPLPAAVLAGSEDEAVRAAAEIGGRVALKIVSSKIVHKSDAGGVRLNLSGEPEIREGFRQVIRNAQAAADPSAIEGVLVAPMAEPGIECIIGMARDPQFGPAVMFGLGGIFVEVLKDVSFRVLPLFDRDLDGMIREIRGYPVLGGIRGEKPRDVAALKEIIARVGQIALDFPEILEIDLNPVIVHEKGASVVDARIIIG